MPDRTQPPPHGVSISPLWSILLASISKWTVIIARKKGITMLNGIERKRILFEDWNVFDSFEAFEKDFFFAKRRRKKNNNFWASLLS